MQKRYSVYARIHNGKRDKNLLKLQSCSYDKLHNFRLKKSRDIIEIWILIKNIRMQKLDKTNVLNV